MSATVKSVTERTLLTAGEVLFYQVAPAAATYQCDLYFRVTLASDAILDLTYTDGGGTQSVNLATGAYPVGSYSSGTVTLTTVSGQAIQLAGSASVANAVYVSAALRALG